MHKTLLIPITQAVVVKNILRTEVINGLLADKRLRVVCVALTPERTEHYKTIKKHERLVFETFAGKAPESKTEQFFSFLKFYTIKTDTTDGKRYRAYKRNGNVFAYFGGLALNAILSQQPVRKLVRFLDEHLVGTSNWDTLLEKHKPDLVFFANIFDDAETALLRDAKRRKIRTAGFINTWDKVTGRSGIRLLPSHVAVFNETVKEEMLRLADMRPEDVTVAGTPQYDMLIKGVPNSREDFYGKKKIDPKKRIILFAPIGSTFSDSDWDAIDLLHAQIENGTIPNAELLVRFQPNDFADKVEIHARPWMKYDLPGIRFGSERGGDWDMTSEDLQHLLDTLTHVSVVVCYASSISIDAALMDKPVINIDFELRKITDPSKTATFYYETEHYGKALKTGGILLAKSPKHLIELVTRAMEHPQEHREARKKLAESQCGFTDGRSGERLAVFLRERL